MALKLDELEKAVLQLPIHDRAVIALSLIKSLDDDEDEGDEQEIEKLWVDEANRRYKDFKQGKTTLKPADQALREARQE